MNQPKPKSKWKKNGSARWAAIIFARPNHPDPQKRFAKYPFISNEAWSRARMRRDFPDAVFYNLYDRRLPVGRNYVRSFNLITNQIFYINGTAEKNATA